MKKDRSQWVIRKFQNHDDIRKQQIRDWQAVSDAERRTAAWEMVVEYWTEHLKRDPDELRLQRTVTNLRRA